MVLKIVIINKLIVLVLRYWNYATVVSEMLSGTIMVLDPGGSR
jgi:hypothetical protein